MRTVTKYTMLFFDKLRLTYSWDEAFKKAVWMAYLDGVEDGKKGIEAIQWGKD